MEYQFVVPLSISPVQQEYQLGDTLWLETDFSDQVYDYVSQKNYYLQNFDFKLGITVTRISSKGAYPAEQPGAYKSFDYRSEIGDIVDWSHPTYGFGNLVLIYDNNRYRFRTAIIPKDTGLFFFAIFYDNFSSRNNSIEVTDNKCDELMSFPRIQINEGNTNFELFQNNIKLREGRDEFIEWQDREQLYTFYVKPK